MISKRLREVAFFTIGSKILLDVGTDHAYLPIYAIRKKYIKKAIVTDIAFGPLNNAKSNIKKNKMDNYISAKLFDGIYECNADVLTITGMGGELTKKILVEGLNKLPNVKKIIIQANKDSSLVRKYMNDSNYKIINEKIVLDKLIYEIIVYKKGKQKLDELDIIFGPVLRKEKNLLFIRKYKSKIKILEKALKNAKDKEKLINEIDKIRKILE